MPPPRLRMHDIHKRYGSTLALRGVSFELAPSEVHALVGENGAGKSTLMRILSGADRPDKGTMELDGQPYLPSGPSDARRGGVAMIYQELAVAPHLTVEANVLLGLEAHRWGFLRTRRQRRQVREALELLQHPEIRPDTPVEALSPAVRQLIEVARALVIDARVVVFDEPTSSLTQKDTLHLFALIRRLRDRGVGVVYISHFLEEVQQIADRYTVLRDGKAVGTGTVAGTPQSRIIEQMVGQSLAELFPRHAHSIAEPVLKVENLAGIKLPTEASFTLHRGEVLGIFGLVGAGRTEMLRVLFGLDEQRGGKVFLRADASAASTPDRRIRAGLGLLSEDRKSEGLALTQSIADNLTYSWLLPYQRAGWLDLRSRETAVREWLQRLQVRSRGPAQAVAELSGGNQQKIALGRLLHQDAEILLLDEPTRGVDVASKAQLYRLIGQLAAEGKAILMVSSYLPELLGVCDRLAVMTRGRLGPVRPVAEWTEEMIMAEATGGTHP